MAKKKNQEKIELWDAVKKVSPTRRLGVNLEEWRQELYLWALERYDKYDPSRGSLVTWLLTLNCARTIARAERRVRPADIYNIGCVYATEDHLIDLLDKTKETRDET